MIIKLAVFSFLFPFISVLFFEACCDNNPSNKASSKEMIKRGEYLVNFGECNDCHSPKIFTDLGSAPDTTRLLSGYFGGLNLSTIDTFIILEGKWIMASRDLTAWAGPWGIVFAANISPDENTGIGNWSEQMFIKAMRNGLHQRTGRAILPPMPFNGLAGLKDEDLKSIFAYLKSIKPIVNKVPEPILSTKLTSIK